jgi:hypothetical protein
MPNAPHDEIKLEILRTLILLGGDPILLGAIESWCNGLPEQEILADLRNWNEAKALELKEWLPTLNGPEFEAAQAHLHQYEEARGESRPQF